MIFLKTFEDAHHYLTQGTGIGGVTLTNHLYVDWSWLKKFPNIEFFNTIDVQLNDDCIREVITHLDLRHLIYFAQINERFSNLSMEKLKTLYICPLTIGSIDVMNLRYILNLSKESLEYLTISIHCFPTIFGIHSDEKKKDVLETIIHFAGEKLKKVRLIGFNLNHNTFLLNRLFERGVLIEEQTDNLNPERTLEIGLAKFSENLQKSYP